MFELVEEDAYSSSFSLGQQAAIDRFLDKSMLLLEQAKDNDQSGSLEEAIVEGTEIKNNQQNWVRAKVVQKLAHYLATIKKYSLRLFWEVMKEFAKGMLRGEIDLTKYLP